MIISESIFVVFIFYHLLAVTIVARGYGVGTVVRWICPNALVTRFRTRSVRSTSVIITEANVLLLYGVFEFKITQTVRTGAGTEVR